jgi:hypothetical protein
MAESVSVEFQGLPDDAKLRLIGVASELAAVYGTKAAWQPYEPGDIGGH